MLFAPFTRTWWKSLVKGESDAAGDDPLLNDLSLSELPSHGHAEGDVPFSADPPEGLPVFNRDERKFEKPEFSGGGYRASGRGDSGDDREQGRRGRGQQRNQGRRPVQEPHHHHDDDSDESFTHEGDTNGHTPDDPLAPAFDLDRGAPLPPPAHQPLQEPHVNVKSAKEFFNSEILYRFDILDDRDRQELEGRYRIELKGYQGGIWTVIVKEQVDVFNRREEADIVITMHQRDFLQLVNGHLNPQLAIFAQKMRVQGDLRRCISFDRLLSPYQD